MNRPFEAFPRTTRPPASSVKMRDCRRAGPGAWTLLEILMVMSIIAILAGMSFGIATGSRRRAAVARAEIELGVLASALEAYRSHYGAYPWIPDPLPTGLTENGEILFNALAGKLGPRGAVLKTTLAGDSGRAFVDLSRFNLASEASSNLPTHAGGVVTNSFVDPWGNPYAYFYRDEANENLWVTQHYLLFSDGPDLNSVYPATPDNAHVTGRLTDGFESATAVVGGTTVGNLDAIHAHTN